MLSGNAISQLMALFGSLPISVYVFGSTLRCQAPNDLDLLVIYEKTMSACEALALRCAIRTFTEEKLGTMAHVVLLTAEEELEVKFVAHEQCVPIRDVLERFR